MCTLHQRPSKVAGALHAVDGLPKCLRDSRNEQAAVIAIEGDPERITESPGPDFLFPRPGSEWVVARDRIAGKSSIDVDTKDLAEQRLGVLRKTVPRQRLRRDLESLPQNLLADAMRHAAVAKSDVEKPIRAECEATAIVLAARPVDFQENPLRGGVDLRRVARISGELGHAPGMVPALGRVCAQRRRIRREHAAVAGETGMKSKAQKATLLEVLLERQHSWPQVEERLGRQSSVRAKHLYDTILLNDEFSSAAVRGLLEMQRGRQTFRNRLQRQILCRSGRGANQHAKQNHGDKCFCPCNRTSHACRSVHPSPHSLFA